MAFSSFAFACGVGLVSRKSKCAKLATAVYRKVVKDVSILLIFIALTITARQYGEVVLADAASDQIVVLVGHKAVTPRPARA
jgi:hypothetical protein